LIVSKLSLMILTFFFTLAIVSLLHLIPVNPVKEDGLNPKSRKRIMPDPLTEPPAIDPIYEARVYCNVPSITERSMEGHAPHYFKLVSVHVLIRHGDRYPLYAIPKTKRPEIDCTLVSRSYLSSLSRPFTIYLHPTSHLPFTVEMSLPTSSRPTMPASIMHCLNFQTITYLFLPFCLSVLGGTPCKHPRNYLIILLKTFSFSVMPTKNLTVVRDHCLSC
uniref:2-phosphoxylose phosphatase 1 n=1 Tax=Chrysemys picta bellii TaxID=8478 RepID=A0A8C3I301_CHRPI